ncbi:MAG TPA: HAD-IC family P-type ATPase, partial [Solirubrobacterales bacterium]|nr:HAD-IC family P-type ATPase [Solirubrobacterales bacterium]
MIDPEERVDRLLSDLGTGRVGLSPREAERRLEQHGRNEIRRREGPGHLRELARQFTHPLALLLWVAAGLAVVGDLVPLAIAIVAVIVINALFAFAQELQAERATEALQEFLPPTARVRRGGEQVEVDATTLVPGDLLLLSEGDRLSADARLIEGGVEVDMSPLTGESQPVMRGAGPSAPPAAPLESEDLVFSGSLCTAGEAEAVVYVTGMGTQLGRIAALSQRVRAEVSPLQIQVNRAARLIAAVAVAAGVLFLIVGITIAGLPLDDSLTFAIGLLVANVPEGLLPTITLALAVGVRRMARRRALIKRLTAVETLGSTDVICTDKTGTLTEGRMSVELFWADGSEVAPSQPAWDGAPPEPFSGLLRTAVRCNNAHVAREEDGWRRSGDPTESALLTAAAALGEDPEGAQAERPDRRLSLFAFDPRRKRMTTVDVEGADERWLHVKGAPAELLARCETVRSGDGDRPLDDEEREQIVATADGYARGGLRVLGFAERRLHEEREPAAGDDRESVESQLCFLGLAALRDPPRPDV